MHSVSTIDHTIYLDDNRSVFSQYPGFPYLRLSPALMKAESTNKISIPEEQLLLAMHCLSSRLLVISNKNIYIYQIPSKKSFLEKIGSVVASAGLGLIPGLGELLGASDVVQFFKWVWKKVIGESIQERKEDISRAAEGMPTRKEIEAVVWDFHDLKTLRLILCYKDKILLRNGFDWKMLFNTSLEKAVYEPVVITVGWGEIRFAVGPKKAFTVYPGRGWDPLKIAADLIEPNRQALGAAGWSVETANQKLVFKNSKLAF